MGKIKSIDIVFEKVPVFAGQLLRGRLVFASKDNLLIKDISMTVEGSSNTGWAGDYSNKPDASEQWFFRVDIPLNGYLIQFGGLNGKVSLPPAEHQIPFVFPIPPFAPNSFGGEHGFVYYCCKARIAVAGSGETRLEKAIPVVGVEDLNWHPYAAVPLSFHEGYSQRFCCFKLANVSAALNIPRAAYVPGESIDITAEVANRSKNRKVKKTIVQLVQTSRFRCGQKLKSEEQVCAEMVWGELAPGEVRKLEEEPFLIPALPPSFLRGCENITVSYDLLFIVDPGIKFTIPIILGTIPFDPDTIKRAIPKHAVGWEGSEKASPSVYHENVYHEPFEPARTKHYINQPAPQAHATFRGFPPQIGQMGATLQGSFPGPNIPPPPPHHRQRPRAPRVYHPPSDSGDTTSSPRDTVSSARGASHLSNDIGHVLKIEEID